MIVPQPNTDLILQGDCLQVLKELPDNSVDSIVTDPPYGLSFMGKHWDYDVPSVEIWKECLRVLKHGGYLLSFSGTRTYHKICSGIEDAGFEIRDMISWLYGSGFPKSLNIGKQIDKIQGNEREVVGESNNHISTNNSNVTGNNTYRPYGNNKELTKGNSEYEGWGTALKPACEPIVVARKPLSEKNVALNVLKWGTGGINIDGCRVEHNEDCSKASFRPAKENVYSLGFKQHANQFPEYNPQGRFPANVILDEEAGEKVDEQSEISKSSKLKGVGGFGTNKKTEGGRGTIDYERGYNDKGGASRFFYCAKASKSERNDGCEELEDNFGGSLEGGNDKRNGMDKPQLKSTKNFHPTVKPVKLMQYLVRLVTPKNGLVLDPFMGSGTTGIACIKEGFNFIGIEREEEYIKIANARIKCVKEGEKHEE